MAIELVEKFLPYVDEQFSTESKKEHLTNQDFSFTGAHSVKIYKISTGKMNDYGRSGPSGGNWSRYGAVESLNATTERQIVPLRLRLIPWMRMKQRDSLKRQQRWRAR